jgi:hypothetical protein
MVVPFVAGGLPFVHLGEGLELALLAGSALIATVTLLESYRKHGRRVVWLPVLGGVLLWGLSLTLATDSLAHGLLAGLGGALIATGLLWDGRVRHRVVCASHCECPLPHDP